MVPEVAGMSYSKVPLVPFETFEKGSSLLDNLLIMKSNKSKSFISTIKNRRKRRENEFKSLPVCKR